MPGSTISPCNEPDEFAAAIRCGGRVELLLTGRGQFRSRLVRVVLRRVCLRTEESMARIAIISPAADSVTAIVPLDREPTQIWAGIPLRAGTIITIGGRQAVHARTVGPCRSGIICLPARHFARDGSTLNGPGFAVPAGVRCWQPEPAALRSLIKLHHAAIDVAAAQPTTLSNTEAARGLEQEVIVALVDCLSARPVEEHVAARQRHIDIMTRLEFLLQAHPHRIPAVAEISATFEVSARTLWTCCHEHLGMGPGRYLHLRQLQRINHALRTADGATTTVSALARRYGVTELGRFAGSYRALFGELPSETLKPGAAPSRPVNARSGP